MDVGAVSNELEVDPRVRQQCSGHSRITVMKGPGGVGDMGRDCRARVDRGDGGLVVSIAMSDGRQRASTHDLADSGKCTIKFGGNRHHDDATTAAGQQLVDLCWLRIAELPNVVRSTARLADPRPLQMNADEHALVDQRRQHRDLFEQRWMTTGDQARHDRRRPVLRVQIRGSASVVGVGGDEGIATPAVTVLIDESGDQRSAVEVNVNLLVG